MKNIWILTMVVMFLPFVFLALSCAFLEPSLLDDDEDYPTLNPVKGVLS